MNHVMLIGMDAAADQSAVVYLQTDFYIETSSLTNIISVVMRLWLLHFVQLFYTIRCSQNHFKCMSCCSERTRPRHQWDSTGRLGHGKYSSRLAERFCLLSQDRL